VKKSQRKGADGEREVARELRMLIGEADRSGFQQAFRGGFDVMLPHCAIEVKRYAKLTDGMIEVFWKETEDQARQFRLLGVLAYRGDRQKWRYAVPMVEIGKSRLKVDYSWHRSMHLFSEGFVWWYESWLGTRPWEIYSGVADHRPSESRRGGDEVHQRDEGFRELDRGDHRIHGA